MKDMLSNKVYLRPVDQLRIKQGYSVLTKAKARSVPSLTLRDRPREYYSSLTPPRKIRSVSFSYYTMEDILVKYT